MRYFKLTSGLLLALALTSGCSIGGDFIKPVTTDKAVYFRVEDGSISGHGLQVTGKGVVYHSVPCDQADCAKIETHPMP